MKKLLALMTVFIFLACTTAGCAGNSSVSNERQEHTETESSVSAESSLKEKIVFVPDGSAGEKSSLQDAVSNFSEIAPLKEVLMHRPGDEFLNLTPNSLERLLFDVIPYLKTAQEEHDALAEILRSEGVEVVYLTDLVSEALDAGGSAAREAFLKQVYKRSGCILSENG